MSISSRPVDPDDLDLGHLALFVGQAANQWVLAKLETEGFRALKPSHGYLVQHLLAGPRAVGELARLLGVTQQAVSKSVQELEAAGYVTIAPGADARVRRVELSERGVEAVDAARRCRKRLEQRLRRACGADAFGQAKIALKHALSELGGLEAVRARRIRPPA